MPDPQSPPNAPVDPQNEPRPGLLLLVSDDFCILCGAPKVYAEPTRGLQEASGGLQAAIVCMNAPCPMALRAAPLLKTLQRVVKALKR